MSEPIRYTATEIADVLAEAKRLINADRHAHEAGGKRYATRVSLVGIVEQLQGELILSRQSHEAAIEYHTERATEIGEEIKFLREVNVERAKEITNLRDESERMRVAATATMSREEYKDWVKAWKGTT